MIKSRDDKENVDDKYENFENIFINFFDFTNPNHYIGIKNI